MKVYVNGMVWIRKNELGKDGVSFLKQQLRIVPRKTFAYDDAPPEPIDCWSETLQEIGVPRDYFFSTATKEHQIEWCLSTGENVKYESLISHTGTYVEQKVAVDSLIDWLTCPWGTIPVMQRGLHLGAILKADPGFGKTNTALSVIHRLGRTAIVVVHKERLLFQWKKRIERFFPEAKIGIVRESKCQFEGNDIVVAMAQSLALEGKDGKKRYPDELYRWPGVLVIDEIHRIGAPTWSPIPKMFSSMYRLGLSATPRRRDKADDVFWWHIGQIRYTAKKEMPKPAVRLVESGAKGPDLIRVDGTPTPIVINILTRLTWRNNKIISEIVKALKSKNKRKIMILSERLEHLRELDSLLAKACKHVGLEGITTGFYVGEWFTGEYQNRLVKGYWKMDDEGREKAIDSIFQSFKRRKVLEGKKREDGHRLIVLENGWVDLDDLYVADNVEDEEKKKILFKEVDQFIFEIAKEYKILQKKKEKMKAVSEADLYKAEEARVMWVTYQMCGEGIDQPAVDTLGFASPISDVEQAYGRARRKCVPVKHGGTSTPEMCSHYCPWRASECTGKPDAVVFDIVDRNISLSKRRKKYRMEFYCGVGSKVAGDDS